MDFLRVQGGAGRSVGRELIVNHIHIDGAKFIELITAASRDGCLELGRTSIARALGAVQF